MRGKKIIQIKIFFTKFFPTKKANIQGQIINGLVIENNYEV